MAQNDGRGNLEISNMQLLFIRILSLAQMEASVKWAQNFSFEVPPLPVVGKVIMASWSVWKGTLFTK